MKTSMLFFCAFFFTSLVIAQSEQDNSPADDRATTTTEKVKKVANVGSKAASRQQFGPAAKNPLAAGRAGNDSANTRAVPPIRFVHLNSPAYKNRKPIVRSIRYGEPRRAVRKLARKGARYKNRSAKAGG